MKINFKSPFHRKAFVKFISENIANPYCCRREYVAAVFLYPRINFYGNAPAHL